MPVLPPRYLVPPVGVRTRKQDPSGNPTRRDPETGPYGVFIQDNELLARPCPIRDVSVYRPYWHRATNQLRLILWGSDQDRITAADILDSLNIEIDARSFEWDHGLGTGFIEVANWYKAGEQLRLALRDVHIYQSTARFEDVRDFIWERIQINNYPTEWRVTRQEFEAQIHRTAQFYTTLIQENEEDSDDGTFYELEIEDGRGHEELAAQLGESPSPPPIYDLPPPYTPRTRGAERSSSASTGLPRQSQVGPEVQNRLNMFRERQPLRRHRESLRAGVAGRPRPGLRPASIFPAPSFRRQVLPRRANNPQQRRPPRRERGRQDGELTSGSISARPSQQRVILGESSRMRQWLNLR
ncbi:hypothetical protein BDV37DRAFT_280387 [Aspergillus pseudonomiae]|uniref:Uncharacterized protein n=1 Tax=Aspergillus pseudonomiae TaxID=1506151 RepID=A0A5N7DNS8_9EURO|nr:uncharacterized protein BDV37DRAFT_280387 [Aspergillus pseudonomiae]KAE8407128.1 hypothetical protein BDV37DRAFT_280387 [Aspergillus pseudonomiae]